MNISDPSGWGTLPEDMQVLLREVQCGTFPYPECESAWQQVMEYLQNGNFFMAKHTLEEIQSRQDNLRQ